MENELKNSNLSGKRLRYIDIARGIAIISILLGHMSIYSLSCFVFTYHVPVFFLVSGYFISEKKTNSQFIKHKLRTLIVPYWIICMAIIILSAIIELLTGGDCFKTAKEWFIAAVYGSGHTYETPFPIPGIGAIWFLWALFFAGITVKLLVKADYRIRILGIAAAFAAGYLTSHYLFWFPFSIQAGLCSAVYVYAGYLAHKYEDSYHRLSKEVKAVIFILAVLVFASFIMNFDAFWIVTCDFGRGFLNIAASLCACFVVFAVSRIIDLHLKVTSKFLAYIGKNSLFILFIHMLQISLFKWIEVFNYMIPPVNDLVRIILIVLLSLTFDIGIVCMLSKISFIRKAFGAK